MKDIRRSSCGNWLIYSCDGEDVEMLLISTLVRAEACCSSTSESTLLRFADGTRNESKIWSVPLQRVIATIEQPIRHTYGSSVTRVQNTEREAEANAAADRVRAHIAAAHCALPRIGENT